ncbi:MAG: hypothetical protein A2Y38_20185 [Spirochaetes bacterium GWB1_59_5]|nr:MAG: hypothetical protein A2Y38_20185 [Spirochaetes bacterium GWB1_59_5]
MRLNPLRAFKSYRVLERANDALVTRVETQAEDLERFQSWARALNGIPQSMEANLNLIAAACPYRFRVGVKRMRSYDDIGAQVTVTFTGWPESLLARIRQAGYIVHAWDMDDCAVVVSEAPGQHGNASVSALQNKTA